MQRALTDPQPQPPRLLLGVDPCAATTPPLQLALAQTEGNGFLIEGHPEPLYNGLYARVGETPDGWPRFENAAGMHLYRCECGQALCLVSGSDPTHAVPDQEYEQWFLWEAYTPDSDIRSTKIETASGELPVGKVRWEYFRGGEWLGVLLTLSAVGDRRRHLERALSPEPEPEPEPFRSHSDMLGRLLQRGHKPRVLGHTPDHEPLVVIEGGGDKLPPILISAGAHSTEQAGVSAAVELADELQTEHRVYILPCRDPMGMNGFNHVLSLGLGGVLPELSTVDEAAALLREKGEVLWDKGGRLLALLGDHAYTVLQGAGDKKGSSFIPTDSWTDWESFRPA